MPPSRSVCAEFSTRWLQCLSTGQSSGLTCCKGLQTIIFDGGVHYLAVGRSRLEPVLYLQDLCSGQVVKRKTLFGRLSQWVCLLLWPCRDQMILLTPPKRHHDNAPDSENLRPSRFVLKALCVGILHSVPGFPPHLQFC